ncbi:MAG: hypothetical protein ACFHWX_06440 [Bacteroidota bacterium]
MRNLAILIFQLFLIPGMAIANSDPSDTVVIELTSKSKIVIQTEDREELSKLENYDINKMIKDLNSALGSKKVEIYEFEDSTGQKYLKDTTIVFGDKEVKTSIKIGNMELLIDAEDWDELEDEFDDESIETRKYSFEEESIDRTKNSFNIDLGLTNWMENGSFPDATGQNYTVKPWASWFVGLNSVNKTWIGGPMFIEWGGGINWLNWKMQDTDILVSKDSANITFEPVDPALNTIKSKLSATYLNVNLVPMFDFSQGRRKVKNIERGSVTFRKYDKQGIRFGVGMYAGYRLANHSKFVYKDAGGKEKDKEYGNFYLENFRYGLRAQVGYKGMDIFATYDLNNVFAPGKGPELTAFSFGITL